MAFVITRKRGGVQWRVEFEVYTEKVLIFCEPVFSIRRDQKWPSTEHRVIEHSLNYFRGRDVTMQVWESAVGRKVVMAITGQLMVLFVIVHLLGNSSIFVGPDGINAYAKHLHDLGPLVWIFRLVMLGLISLHVFFGIQLTLENSAATVGNYAVIVNRKSTFSSRTMIWTGVIILLFIIYHLAHFTARVTPGLMLGTDAAGRFDVYSMVVGSFSRGGVAFVYVVAMIALFLHLFHGIQSFFQTMGWNNDTAMPKISAFGKTVAFVLLVGYVSIPVTILAGILSK